MKDVAGKVAVVTGAASGIGLGITETFVSAGMKVVMADIEQGPLEAASRAVLASGGDVHPVVTDVAKPDQMDRLARETLKKYGAAHVLCNNAGIGNVRGGASWESTLDDWNWIVGVNMMGVVHGQRAFLPIMIRQGSEAHIVNTSSLAGLLPGLGTLYAMTKAAVVSLSESTYFELQHFAPKIGVSVLCPAWVDTNILNSDRNRPAEYGDTRPGPRGPMNEVFAQWLEQQLKEGLSPRTVGARVLDAIREQRFYVLTHPEWTPLIENRMHRMLAGDNPVLARPPGFESLMQMMQARLAKSS